MATRLHKVVSRLVEITGQDWIISFIPANEVNRFDCIAFRPKGRRRGGPSEYVVPVESARNHAAERIRLARIAQRKADKKMKRFVKEFS
jgi:hypothetical protein